MSGPIFKPNDTVWHVRHGKVTLKTDTREDALQVILGNILVDYCTINGKKSRTDVGRVLYTLAEAAQYGWLPKEPLVVEFEVEDCGLCTSDSKEKGQIFVPEKYRKELYRKRVLVAVRTIEND